MPHGNRPPEKLAPGRSVASNCPYVVTEIQERYFILGLPGSRKRLRVVKKNKDLEYLERWPKGIKLLATMKIFSLEICYWQYALHFFFIRTPNFLPRLDVLIFSAISASDVLNDVLNYMTIKIRY